MYVRHELYSSSTPWQRPFVRTNPIILQKIKEVVTATSGEAGPSKLYKEAIETSETDDLHAVPRDMKQVSLNYLLSVNLLTLQLVRLLVSTHS